MLKEEEEEGVKPVIRDGFHAKDCRRSTNEFPHLDIRYKGDYGAGDPHKEEACQYNPCSIL